MSQHILANKIADVLDAERCVDAGVSLRFYQFLQTQTIYPRQTRLGLRTRVGLRKLGCNGGMGVMFRDMRLGMVFEIDGSRFRIQGLGCFIGKNGHP